MPGGLEVGAGGEEQSREPLFTPASMMRAQATRGAGAKET